MCWRQIFSKTMGEKKRVLERRQRLNLESRRQCFLKSWHLASQPSLWWPTFSSQRPFGAGVLKWFVCFRYVVKQKCLWLQCCDSATLEGGINYLIYANCISVTLNWRCYQVWVRQWGDKGPTAIADERKDSKVGPWMNVQPISKISYLLSSYFF